MRPSLLEHFRHTYQSVHYFLILTYAFELFGHVLADNAADHLEFAKKLLAAGKYSDALPHFHEAINSDPNNYLTYFKRATVFLALNRPKSALEDLNKALELNGDFTSALNQRASLQVKLGNLDQAHIDYEQILRREPDNNDAIMMYNRIENLREGIENAQDLIEENQFDEAINALTAIIEVVPFNTELLKMRASAFERMNEYRRAIGDLRTTAKLNVDASTYLEIAKLCYKLGEVEESLDNVRECLKLDPDHKSCMTFYKPTKKLNNHLKNMIGSRESKDNDDCVLQGKNALKMLKDYPNPSPLIYSIQTVMCNCLSKAGDITEGLKICNEALGSEQIEGVEGLAVDRAELICDKADLLADKEDYVEAQRLYQESSKIKQSKRAREGAEKMKRLQKQKKKRDYYKILGVSRGANEGEINKAYRKLAAKWHPDRHQDAESKKLAQAKFMDIADAKAVLTDPEKRRQYDSGEDPLDPESKQQRPHPQGFYSHFNNFGDAGSPFTFKFNF